jgi:hypothetical protein
MLAGGYVATHQPAASARTAACGVERWSVKTGTDAGAANVSLTPRWASIRALNALTPPSRLPFNTRIAPTEDTVFYVSGVTLASVKEEADSDYHLVLVGAQGRTMIAEIPSPTCVGNSSSFSVQIAAARAAMDARYAVGTSWLHPNVKVRVAGVGFFDFIHGQSGVADNGIEIHPVLSLTFQ